MFTNKKDLFNQFQQITLIQSKITFLNKHFNTITNQFNIHPTHLKNIISNWEKRS